MGNRLSFQLLVSARMLLESARRSCVVVKDHSFTDIRRSMTVEDSRAAEIVDSLANGE